MLLGVCCSLDRMGAAAEAGADYVEPAVNDVALPEGPVDAWRERLARLRDGLPPLAWNCLLPGDLKVAGPTADLVRLKSYAAVAAERLAEAGARVVVFGSGGSRNAPEGFPVEDARSQFAEAAAIVAEAFAPAGILVCVEPLRRAETNVLNTVPEALAFVREIGRSNLRVTADLYHMRESGEPIDFTDAGPGIGHAHAAGDGRTGAMDGADVDAFVAALREAGYDGMLSIEAGWGDFDSEVGPAIARLRALATGGA